MRTGVTWLVFAPMMLGASLSRASEATSRPAAAPLSVERLIVDRADERVAVLSNGLTVILKAHRTAPVVAVRMYCKTGSIYEQE